MRANASSLEVRNDTLDEITDMTNGRDVSFMNVGEFAMDRFPEREVWISSHRLRIWSRSGHVPVVTIVACLSSESLWGTTL